MATQLVTGVTLGGTGAFGEPGLGNDLKVISPIFFGGERFGISQRIFIAGTAGNLTLNLTGPYHTPAATSLSFALSGAPLLYAGAGNLGAFGYATVTNAARAAYPARFGGELFGGATRASFDVPARELALNIAGSYTPSTAMNVGMYMDGRPLVPDASVGIQVRFGTTSVHTSWETYPAGIAGGQVGSQLRVAPSLPANHLLLNLEGSYVPPAATALSFALSGAPLVLATCGVQGSFGLPSIANAAKALYPRSWSGIAFGSVNRVNAGGEGNWLVLNLAGNYVPPNAASIQMYWATQDKDVACQGFDAGAWGRAVIVNAAQGAFAKGWRDDTFGVSVARAGKVTIGTHGFTQIAWGVPTLINRNRTIIPEAISSAFASGTAWVSLRTRRLQYITLGQTDGYGTPQLAGGVRWLYTSGAPMGSLGAATTWFRVRQLYPPGFPNGSYGKPVIGFEQIVAPSSIAPGIMGTGVQVHYPRTIADLSGLGIAPAGAGQAVVWNYTQIIAPKGYYAVGLGEADRFGFTYAYNLRQYIAQLFNVTINDGGVFGDPLWMSVVNKNRYVGPGGIIPGRYGTASVYNNARKSFVDGWDNVQWGNNLVAYRIRMVYPAGTLTTQWGRSLNWFVYNAARVLAPSGIVAPSPQFGKPNPVWSNLQTLKMVGAAATRWGLPMVAYRIRRLMTFGITPPVFGSVHPQLWKRYVDLTNRGIAPVGPGVPSLRVWRIEFGPSAITAPMPQFGVQAVRNKTPELHPFGYPQTLWGSTQIHNQWTRYAFQGFKSDSFGATQVSYRTRIVAPPGASTLYVSPLLQVFNNTPNPPPMQRALPASIPYGGIGSVSLWQPIITPGGVAPGSLGAPGVVSMGIGPQGISPPFDKSTGVQFGIPFIPGYQVVIPPAIPPDRSDQTPAETFGTASFGPFYVWAPHGYPYDAGIGERGELMDNRFIGQNNPARPFWGNATVTNQNRVVGVINYGGDASFGTAFVTQRPRWLRSTGSKLQKFGYPVLNGGGGAQCYGFDMSLIGLVDVAHAPYRGPQTVLPVGIGATGWGDAWVANWIRNLYPSGWEEFEVSPPAPPSWPRVSTWVSIAYPPFPAAGTVMSLYGTPWVSFRIRSLDPSGWVDESFGFTPGYFSDRMRVRERHIVKAKGWMSAACGAPRISNRLTVAAPRGAAPGGFGLVNVRKQKRVNVPGTQMGIFGDVQRWIADTIQVQGQDLSALGKAVLRSVIDAHGFAGAMGASRPAHAIRPAGIAPPAVTSVPTAVWNNCGNKAMAAHGFDALAFGEVTVT